MRLTSKAMTSVLMACAGAAVAQPTVDGLYDAGTESGFYGDILWTQNVPTGFGDNSAGLFQGGEFGNPEVVDTGVELSIPLASLGLSGTETIRIAGWVNSGDRTFKSNQIIGALPIDTNNLGGASDFNAAPLDATTQHIEIDLSAVPSMGATVDGSLGADSWSQEFLQGNFTGFGDETDGTVDGSGPNGGGSEIDGIYIAKDGSNLYIFIAGNLENNGNAMDLYIDTGAGGDNELSGASGDGGFIVDAQSGQIFDAGFDADYVVSIDTWNDDDDDGTTPNVPRAFFGAIDSDIDDLGSLAGFGSANAGALSAGISMGIDNSNVEGVIGSQSESTPVSPDANWGYGSELDNVRSYIDTDNNKLYVFIAGNIQNNYNKFVMFFDVQAGGQNVLLDNNVDISFNGLNGMSNITFDSGFEPDYWINVNNGVDGGTGDLQNYADAAVLRTNGANIDPIFGVITDYGSYFGGEVSVTEVMDFSGPQVDIQDGSLASLFANYAPRMLEMDPFNPVPGLLQVSLDNSNVAGVTGDTASSAAAAAVNSGVEICIDLDELGWDGEQDILMGGWIANDAFSFISNQVLGGLPDGSENIGERDADADGTNDLDFNTIAGDQFINLSAEPMVSCPADLNEDGLLDFFDISFFLSNSVDFNEDTVFDFFDISAFLGAYGAGCP